jgi:hypothetical protein
MNTLSREILYIIAGSLDLAADISAFRLSCKLFADIGAYYLLPELCYLNHFQELERLEKIREHPLIPLGVTSLHYDGNSLLRIGRKPLLRRQFMEIGDSFMSPETQSFPEVCASWERYKQAYALQLAMIQENLDLDIVEKLIKRLPRLRKVTVSSNSSFISKKRARNWHPKQQGEGMLLPAAIPYDDEGPMRQLQKILMTSHEAGIKLKKLRAGRMNCRVFETLHSLGTSLAALTSLKLLICVNRGSTSRFENADLERIQSGIGRNFLKSLNHLTTLEVQMSYNYLMTDPFNGPVKLEWIFDPEYKWEHLRKLTIGGMRSEEDSLIKLFSMSRDMLQYLKINSHTLNPGKWRSCFQKIQETLNLKDAELSGILRDRPICGPSQRWHFSGGHREYKTAEEVQKFLVHGGKLPSTPPM